MIIDLIVLAVLLISAGVAFLRGFIREVLTILGVVGGAVAMIFAGPLLAPIVKGWFGGADDEDGGRLFGIVPYDLVADAVAYGGVFLLVVIILSIASHFLSEGAKGIGLGALDRTLGIVFGLLRGIILLALLYLPFYLLMDKGERASWLDGSKSGFYIETVSGWLAHMLPEGLGGDLEDKAASGADDVMKVTRQRLQEIDVLQAIPQIVPSDTTGAADNEREKQGDAPAYDQEDRQEINNLFSDSLNE